MDFKMIGIKINLPFNSVHYPWILIDRFTYCKTKKAKKELYNKLDRKEMLSKFCSSKNENSPAVRKLNNIKH